jgi:uncharacterized HAD superfamily protein
MRIGFDIDGVIVDYHASLKEFLETKYGMTLQNIGVAFINPSNVESYYPKLSLEIIRGIQSYMCCCSIDFVRNGVLRQSVLDSIHKLYEAKHTLALVTNRGEKLKAETLKSLGTISKCFQYAAFACSADKDYYKVNRCKILQLDILIEDNINNLIKVAEKTLTHPVFFAEEPWLASTIPSRNHTITTTNSKHLIKTLDHINRRLIQDELN